MLPILPIELVYHILDHLRYSQKTQLITYKTGAESGENQLWHEKKTGADFGRNMRDPIEN